MTRAGSRAFLGSGGNVVCALILTFALCATLPENTVWITDSLAMTAEKMDAGIYFFMYVISRIFYYYLTSCCIKELPPPESQSWAPYYFWPYGVNREILIKTSREKFCVNYFFIESNPLPRMLMHIRLDFIARTAYENILTMKISLFPVLLHA